MSARILSVSAAPYDGYEFPRILESLASCGATHVEPAFIVGYTEPFGESAFSESNAQQYSHWLKESGLGCFAFSSHIDLGRADAADVFRGRMEFAKALGATVINTNAAARLNEKGFFRNIETLADYAQELDMLICLENPGDGSDNLINVAQDGINLLTTLNHPCLRLNYDAGNTISHRPINHPGYVNPTQDALLAMPACGHVHIKAVKSTSAGFFFTPLSEGDIDCAAIVQAVAKTDLNLSIEMPLRLHRMANSQPARQSAPIPLPVIESALREALSFVRAHLGENKVEIKGALS